MDLLDFFRKYSGQGHFWHPALPNRDHSLQKSQARMLEVCAPKGVVTVHGSDGASPRSKTARVVIFDEIRGS